MRFSNRPKLREAQNRGQGLIVSGCLPQRFREELPKLLPEVDAFMGIDQVAQAPQIVQQAIAQRAKRRQSRRQAPERKNAKDRSGTLPFKPAAARTCRSAWSK